MRSSQSLTLSYLKRNCPSNEFSVNRLFVSAFVRLCGVPSPNSAFLSSYMIERGDGEYGLLLEVCKCIIVEFGSDLSLETIVKLFEFVVSPADRVVTGAVYTPARVRSAIISTCLGKITAEDIRVLRIADIACGCGGFLMDVALLIHKNTGKAYADIYHDNIFGIDIQPYAVERTKILLSLLALTEGEDADFEFNLLCRDSLEFKAGDWDERYKNFDVIVGNPPYVCSRNLSEETREKLRQYEVCRTGHPDLYIPFFQIAIEMLSSTGQMGYITMNTFLRSVNGRALRRFLSNNRFAISILDFRGFQVFDSRNTYTCLFFLDKAAENRTIRYTVDECGILSTDVDFSDFRYDIVDDNKGWSLNNFKNTLKIESVGIQIKDYCSSRHGIATLCNSTYIFRPKEEDKKYYYLNNGAELFPIEKSICRDVVNPNKLQTVESFDSLIEKLIFPYMLVNDKINIIEPDVMANAFPQAWRYLNKKRDVLLSRDKGKTDDYPQWYAYGRTQSLMLPRYKLFFPKFANQSLKCIIRDDMDLMLYNGLAFVNDDIKRLRILKAIIESDLFWEYIRANGKPYASGYYSLSGVDIKHFGIPCFCAEEEEELLNLHDKVTVDKWLRKFYFV